MFKYGEMTTTTFNGGRWYTDGVNFYPSITTILGITTPDAKKKSLADWGKSVGLDKAKKIGEDAAARGTSVHSLIEQHIAGQEVDFSTATQIEKSIFNGLKLKLKLIDEVWGSEVALCSDVIGVAGRCDCIGVFRGKPCIIDFKTSTRNKKISDTYDYRLQITAYALMHNEQHGTEIEDGVILMGVEGGVPLEFRFNINEYIEPLVIRVEKFYSGLPK